jgi:hypothetical protein
MRKVEEDGSCSDRCVLFEAHFRRRGYECGSCESRVDPTKYNTRLGLRSVPIWYRKTFRDAASRWDDVIVGDIPEFNTALLGDSVCGKSVPTVIDDIFICAEVVRIDGRGGILGSAGIEWCRDSPILPATGNMRFDKADVHGLVNKGVFDSVIVSYVYFLV